MSNPNMTFARALVASLHAAGVRHAVVCPGSRSGPLALAFGEAAANDRRPGAPEIELHVRVDERSAAFTALGIARARLEPVAVVTTSGTAVGNLLPATMEAAHSGVPLILLTGDRPFLTRGTGANQTTDQRTALAGFATRVRDVSPPSWGRDLEAEAAELVAWTFGPSAQHPGGLTGPAHLNLQFGEPIEPDTAPWPAAPVVEFPPLAAPKDVPLPDVPRGIVVAGDGAGRVAATVAAARGWPLLAEPTSGARAGRAAVAGYVEALASERGQELAAAAQLVVVIGRPTLSRPVSALIAGAKQLWVAGHGALSQQAPLNAAHVLDEVPESWRTAAADPDPEWLERWLLLGREPERQEWGTEAVALAALAAARGGVLLLGSSAIIRAADRTFPALADVYDVPLVVANRGLAGIDGTVSTAMGLALGGGTRVVAAMGDLTFLHDVGGLLIGPLERTPDLTIVVANDGGGRIFERLEHARAERDIFERVFVTPHRAHIEAIAEGYGAHYRRADSAAVLERALADPPAGVLVVEAMLPGASAS